MTKTKSSRPLRPKKPRKDFPLFSHANGQWSKKVLGRLVYFGPWEDPEDRSKARQRELADAAERLWDLQKADLKAGRKPREQRPIEGTLTVRELCNDFMSSQELRVKTGELSGRQFDDYHRAVKFVADVFGRTRSIEDLGPADFRDLKSTLAEKYKAPSSLKREMTNCRAVFNWAMRNGHVERIIRFGDDFKLPTTTQLRKHKQQQKRKHGSREFTAEQCRSIIAAANPALKAMALLGLNCGLGNTDIRLLQFADIDLESNWLDYPRNKTGMDRVVKLWDETTEAVRDYLLTRKEPNDDAYAKCAFITRSGNPYGDGTDGNDPIAMTFYKLLKRIEIYRPGLSFYTLRHTYRTQADSIKDEPAVNLTMGHVDPSMGANYRQHIGKHRLEAVADHVHAWLFKSGGKAR